MSRFDDSEPENGKEPAADARSRDTDNFIFKSRKIFIVGEINSKMAKDVVLQLHALAAASDDPIKVFVSSPGGHVESGDLIHDAIRFIKPKVIMIGSGWVASAGALIFIAAEKKSRFSLPNTRFLLHQPSGGVGGKVTDISIQAEEIRKMRERLNAMFARETGQSIDKIAKDTDRDFWMSAEEAIAYGLVSKIITSESELPAR